MARITSQATSVEVPPPNGAKLKVEDMGLSVTEDWAATDNLSQLIVGKWDHGPVHATTTLMSTRYGIQAESASLAEFNSSWFEALPGADAGAPPPNPRIVLG